MRNTLIRFDQIWFEKKRMKKVMFEKQRRKMTENERKGEMQRCAEKEKNLLCDIKSENEEEARIISNYTGGHDGSSKQLITSWKFLKNLENVTLGSSHVSIRAGVQWKNHVFFLAGQGLHPVEVWRLPAKFQAIQVIGNRHRHTPPYFSPDSCLRQIFLFCISFNFWLPVYHWPFFFSFF